ncbi:SpaA isopeptide-forming pilin-related protein, partial [Ruminococcus sp.]|uniref:SpaA isopeptide-forming pilin-related protein n=1 Tax=Ruminococcus sp. TaxID=41978 RepID=UPI001B7C9978
MKKSLGKRLISSVTSGVLAMTYVVPSFIGMQAYAAADGLPVINTPYEQTQWFRNNPLGIAGDFHLFAFDTIETTNTSAHINGNIATPNYIIGSNHGQLNTEGTGRILNVVRDSFVFKEGGDYEADAVKEGSKEFSLGKMSDFFFPENCELYVKKGEYIFGVGYVENEKSKLDYPQDASPYPYIRIDLPQSDSFFVKLQPGGDYKNSCYLAHTGNNLIDFESEKKNYENRSAKYAQFDDSYANLKFVENPDYSDDPSNQTPYLGTLTLNENGTNVLNFTADELDNYRNMKVENINFKDGQFYGDQTLVVNIDLKGKSEIIWTPEWTYESAYDPTYKLVDSEQSALSGTNIIYNFFNANSEGTKILYNYGEKLEPWGCVLAPDCEVVPNNMSGSIIANKITLTNQTHMAPFMNPVSENTSIKVSAKKTWSDGEDKHEDDEIEVTLYRSKKAGLRYVTDEADNINKFTDFVETVNDEAKTAVPITYEDGGTIKTVNSSVSAQTVTSKFGFGAETTIFYADTDEIVSSLPDGTYTFKKGEAEKFVITVADGYVDEISGPGIGFKEYETKTLSADNDWTATWDGLEKSDEDGHTYFYYAIEDDVPDGYKVSYTDNGVSGGNRTIGITNTGGTPDSKVKFVKYSDVMFANEDSEGVVLTSHAKELLEGAQFTLTAKDSGGAKLNSGVKSDLDDDMDADVKYSDTAITWTSTDKAIEFTGIPDGLYTLTETAPDGFQPIKATDIRIDGGKASVVTADTGASAKSTGESNSEITMVDESYAISVKKVDENGKAVQGAYLRLKGTSGESMKNVKAHDSQYFTSDGKGWGNKSGSNFHPYKFKGNEIKNISSDGKSFEWYSIGSEVVFTGLPEGTYSVEELTAPAGYVKDTVKTFTVKRTDGVLSADNDVIEFVNRKETVKISKGDMGSVIVDNAEFVLTKKDGSALGVLTTDDSSIDLSEKAVKSHDALNNTSGVTIKDLKSGQKYTIRGNTFRNVTVDGKEVSPSSQYTYEYSGAVLGTSLELKGIYSGTYTIEFEDGNIFTLSVEEGDLVPTVSYEKVLKLTDSGKALEFTGGSIDIIGLDNDDYILKETASPNGYTKVESEFGFTVKDGKVTVTDAKTTGTYKLSDDGKQLIILDDISKIEISKFYDKEGNTTPAGTTAGADMKLTFKKGSGKAIPAKKTGDALGEGESAEWNSKDANPKTFEGLYDGEYVLEETKAPQGYEKAAAKTFVIKDGVIVETDADKNVVSTRTSENLINTKQNTIILDKKALGATEIPESAGKVKFTLTAEDEDLDLSGVSINGGEALGTVTSTEPFDGNTVTFTGLKDGTYTLREDTAPLGYSVVSDFTFTVKDGKVTNVSAVTTGRTYIDEDGHIVVEDAPTISIDKTDLGGKMITDGEAEFTLTAKDTDGSLSGVKINDGEALGDVKSATFAGSSTKLEYLKDGKYSLKEDTAPAGYSTVSEFTFTIKNGLVTDVSTVTDGVTEKSEDGKKITVKDAPIINLDKLALGAEPIPESAGKATFVLTAEDEGKTLEGVKINGGDAVASGVKSVKVDGNNAKIEYLKDGKYSLEETVAPDGYTTVTKFTFTVKDGKVTDVSTVTDGKAYVDDKGHLVVEDRQTVVTLDKKALGAEPIPESAGKATFVLTAEDEGKNLDGVVVGEGEKAQTLTADDKSVTFDGNSAKFTGLKDGKYSLEETVAPDGYTTVTKFTFTVENGKVKDVSTVTDGKAYVDEDGHLVVEDKQSTITLDKLALGATPIPESAGKASFVLQIEEEGKTLEGVKVNGGTALGGVTKTEFKGNNTKFEGLKDGKYSLEETAAPEGYTTVTKFTFTVENGKVKDVSTVTDGKAYVDEDGHLVVEDAHTGIVIDKLALGAAPIPESAGKATFVLAVEETGKTLAGVKIDGGETLGEVTKTTFTGNNTQFTGLKDGKYSLEETAAPDGYTTVTKFTFTIKDGKVTDVSTVTDGKAYVDENGHLVVEDTKNTITLDKKSLGAEPIPESAGKATFVLAVEETGKTLEGVTVGEGEKAKTLTA